MENWKQVPPEFFSGVVTAIKTPHQSIYLKDNFNDKTWNVFCEWCDGQEWKLLTQLKPISYKEFQTITERYDLNDFCRMLRVMDNRRQVLKNKTISQTALNWLGRGNTKSKGVHQ